MSVSEKNAISLADLPACPVEYTLTNLGYSLQPIMDAMWSWGENYKKKLSAEESETA